MTTKEKARAYDEAIRKAAALYKASEPMSGCNVIIETLFPELAESEGEKIRKWIIDDIRYNIDNEPLNNSEYKKQGERAIAWLEKQGKQKPILDFKARDWYVNKIDSKIHNIYHSVDKVEPKFKVGDVLCDKSCTTLSKEAQSNFEITDIRNGMYICDKCSFPISQQDEYELVAKRIEQKPTDKVEPKFHESEWITNGDYTWKIVEIKPLDYILQSQDGNIVDDTISHVDEQFHSFTIQDAKDGDVLYFSDETIVIFKDLYNATTFHSYCHIEDGEFGISCEELPDWWEGKGFHPATKEQRDLLFQKMNEAGYEWDAEKKELKKVNSYCQENCKGFQETGKCFADGECKAKKEAEQKLAESEDERIREALIRFHKSTIDIDGIKGADIISWLEKQGEQKPTDKVKPKFHEGEWITDGYDVLQISNVDIENQYYNCVNGNDGDINLTDKAYHLWTIQDVKDGDVLTDVCGNIGIYNKHNAFDWTSYCSLGRYFQCFKAKYENEKTYPATKEQRDLLFQKMHEAGYMWDSESKQLLSLKAEPSGEQKPTDEEMKELLRTEYEKGRADAIAEIQKEWSEEDEETLGWLCTFLKEYGHKFYEGNEENVIGWLKSLKDRVQPKQEWGEEEIEKAAQEWDSKASFNPFYMTMEGDKPTGVKQHITTHKESFKAGVNWILKSLRPQNNITDEELAQAKKDAYNDALDKIEYHSGEPTFDDGWSAAIDYIQKKSLRPQNRWKPSDEQLKVLHDAAIYIDHSMFPCKKGFLMKLYKQLKKLKEE